MMAAVSDGISSVRVFGLAVGTGSDGKTVANGLSVLVKWDSVYTDGLHQVYVDGELAGATSDCQQRMLEVSIFSGSISGAEIEVYAVSPEEAGVDFSKEPGPSGRRDRARLSISRSMSLSFAGKADFYFDFGSGQVDYGQPISKEPLCIWPSRQDKGGFGLAVFGAGEFGYEAGIGFGRGNFGKGEFGFDADETVFETSELSAGNYRFGVELTDVFGIRSEAVESQSVTMIPIAQPPEGLSVNYYDKQQDKLVLTVN